MEMQMLCHDVHVLNVAVGRSDHSLEHQQHSNVHNPQFPLDKAGEPMQQSVALIPLTNQNLTTISRESQLQDESIGVVLRAVESGHKLADDILQGLNPESRKLHEQWDLLQVKHGKLWRSLISPHGTTSHLQLIVPYSLRQKVLAELHDGPLGGHLGGDKMYSRLKQRFYWPGSTTDVKHWCATCSTCAARKTSAPHNRAPLHTIQSGYPMQIAAVDIVGPFPDSPNGNRYILVAMDYFTRWAEVYAIPNQEASTVAEKLVNEFFLRFSPPEQLHSDQGRQFESSLMK